MGMAKVNYHTLSYFRVQKKEDAGSYWQRRSISHAYFCFGRKETEYTPR